MAVHVLDEATRCLRCAAPRCRDGCPINTPIPDIVRLLLEERLDEAGETLYANNPLTMICSLVCDHDRQCEGHCVLGRKGAPVHFSTIESYISSTYNQRRVEHPSPVNGIRVAIIGSGPAGLAISAILAQRGYSVTIFEAKSQLGGVLRYGIPEYRLPNAVIDAFVRQHLRPNRVRIRPNCTIGIAISIDDLLRDGYRAIFAGTGMWRPGALHIKGETLGNVHFGINYLANPESFDLGRHVIVIGAGNAAMDVARTALRHGCRRVQCVSRTEQLTASKHEIEYARLEGVEFLRGLCPTEMGDDGVMLAQATEAQDGRIEVRAKTARLHRADSVIIAIGQKPRDRLVKTTEGLETSDQGLLIADHRGHTSRPEIFSAGDVVSGAGTVVEAVTRARAVADAMDRYLRSPRPERSERAAGA